MNQLIIEKLFAILMGVTTLVICSCMFGIVRYFRGIFIVYIIVILIIEGIMAFWRW